MKAGREKVMEVSRDYHSGQREQQCKNGQKRSWEGRKGEESCTRGRVNKGPIMWALQAMAGGWLLL